MPRHCFRVIFATYILICTIWASAAQADILLNWRTLNQATQTNIVLTYRDKNHIVISLRHDFKLLKLHNELFLLHSQFGFKVAFNLSKLNAKYYSDRILNQLPAKEAHFLPVMVLNGAQKIVQGFTGQVIMLHDFDKTITVISSHNKQHIDIKNALLPMFEKLVQGLPNLPNRQLIEILKISEFGLPLHIEDAFILTKSETVKPIKNLYTLNGYKVVSSLKDMVF